jgi:hypothetical protein
MEGVNSDRYSIDELPAFLADHITRDPLIGCWAWQRSLNRDYGQVWIPQSEPVWTMFADDAPGPKRVHRLVWQILVSPAIDSIVLDHRCEWGPCSNPAHLMPTSLAENSRRNRGIRRTHCKRGHLLPPAGERTCGCRICGSMIAKAKALGLPHPDEVGVYDPTEYGLTEDGRSRGRRRS